MGGRAGGGAMRSAARLMRVWGSRRIQHSDRGSQYASADYRQLLTTHGLVGSMSHRGNPYDNAKAKSFMKTLKVEAVYLRDYETFEDVPPIFPASSTRFTIIGGSTPRSAISAPRSSKITTPGRRSKSKPNPVRPQGRTPPS